MTIRCFRPDVTRFLNVRPALEGSRNRGPPCFPASGAMTCAERNGSDHCTPLRLADPSAAEGPAWDRTLCHPVVGNATTRTLLSWVNDRVGSPRHCAATQVHTGDWSDSCNRANHQF